MLLHEVISTEKVPFTYRVAGMGSRLLAWMADTCAIILLVTMGVLLAGVLETGRSGLGDAVMYLWSFTLWWGYYLLFEWLWQGQTPGKRLAGIRVIQWEGTSITFFQSAVRNLLRVVDMLPLGYGLAFAIAVCNREHRRLGDLAAGTLVVHIEGKAQPIRVLHEDQAAGLPNEPTLRHRLGQLDRAQKQLLLDLCLRRNQLRVHDRAQLFHLVAEYLQARFELAAAEHQSDEKFVLQLLSAISGQ